MRRTLLIICLMLLAGCGTKQEITLTTSPEILVENTFYETCKNTLLVAKPEYKNKVINCKLQHMYNGSVGGCICEIGYEKLIKKGWDNKTSYQRDEIEFIKENEETFWFK